MKRREFLLSAAAVGAIVGTEQAIAAPRATARPPKGFLWGTAGAAYQIEGGNYASDLWVVEHLKPTIFTEPSGDACNAYRYVADDIALAASLGFNSHRFSIEWSRIEPERGQISIAGLDYYRGVLEACHKHGLAAAVTFSHFTVPRWVAASGGFADPANVAAFAAHCRRVTEAMGDLIHLAATFNEPNLSTVVRWGGLAEKYRPFIAAMQKAAGAATGSPNWASPMLAGEAQFDGILAAHAAAIESIRAGGGKFPVGLTLAITADHAADRDDSGLKRKQRELLDRWLAAPGDFIGVQTYSGAAVGKDVDLPPPLGTELTQMDYAFMPDAVEKTVRLVAGQTSKPIYITENGVATEDDTRRIAYIKGAIAGVQRCLADGIDLRGYFHWSLLDNWEWMAGYRPKFGLVSIDHKTFRRTPKPSARLLGEIARRGGLA
ncbi:MAG: family 1 glycosylhydrolase [Candidatus Sphingomonas colombiensis]|nr:family 1 glycosylhydrolase [Sphingomonas sp.]WEK44049.1 MAG: family 1 glycosylhydrolase [Sphingomonas sp.]